MGRILLLTVSLLVTCVGAAGGHDAAVPAQRGLPPDLSVKGLAFVGTKVSPGVNGLMLTPVLLKNKGDKIATAQVVSIKTFDDKGQPGVSCAADVPPWVTDETELKVAAPCVFGSLVLSKVARFVVTADAGSQVAESDEANNTFQTPMPPLIGAGSYVQATLPGAKKPDLVVHGFKFSPDFRQLTVTAKNVCGGASNDFIVAVDFHATSSEVGRKVFTVGRKVASLPAGGFVDVTLDVAHFTKGQDVRGLNFITLTVDGADWQKEADEANNYLKMGADKKGIFPPPKQNFDYCQG